MEEEAERECPVEVVEALTRAGAKVAGPVEGRAEARVKVEAARDR